MKKQIEVLYQAFEIANKNLFNNEVPSPTITIQTKGKHAAYGWCSVQPIWQGKGTQATHEINLSAEYVSRPFVEIVETLIHELVHLHNITNGIKDCSRGGTYHNKKFQKAAEAVGLIVEKSDKYGWAHTKVSDELAAEILSWGLDETVFNTARIDFGAAQEGKTKKQSSMKKYECPCGIIVRATKEVNIVCMDCGGKFEVEGQAATEGAA